MRATEALGLSDPDTELSKDDKALLTHLSVDKNSKTGRKNREAVLLARKANRESKESLF